MWWQMSAVESRPSCAALATPWPALHVQYMQGAAVTALKDPVAGTVAAKSVHRAGRLLHMPLLNLMHWPRPSHEHICR